MLHKLRKRFNPQALSDAPKENFGDAGAFVVADYHDPTMIALLTWPKSLGVLRRFGFLEPKLHNFYVSTKPPGAAALPWHSDLFYAYNYQAPAEIFLIYYLQDTSPANGCLRVVPGSHLWKQAKRRAQPEEAQLRPDEIDVPIVASSLFIGDRRILHATHANNSATWRTCLTIAYAPTFAQLAESIQALIVQNQCLPPSGWWKAPDAMGVDTALRAILPIYNGHAQPTIMST
jgi:hypothetical protein